MTIAVPQVDIRQYAFARHGQEITCRALDAGSRRTAVTGTLAIAYTEWSGLARFHRRFASLWRLGESPIRVAEESSLYWSDHGGPSIDLNGPRKPSIRRLNFATGERTVWPMPEQVGSFGLRIQGGLIAGSNSGFCAINLERDRFQRIFDPEPGKPFSRLNDGKVDRRGRYWCGSMDGKPTDTSSALYRFDADHPCRRFAEDFTFVCSNGIAFDPQDTRMYFGDTKGGMVYVFDFDINEGRIENRRWFFDACRNTYGMMGTWKS